MTAQEHTGIYVCLTKGCKKHNVETGHPWHSDWPLDKRRKKCTGCRKYMLLYSIKKVMTEEAKRKLKELAARRKSTEPTTKKRRKK